MKNIPNGTRMFLKAEIIDIGVTLPVYSFGIVSNGALTIWSPADQKDHVVVIVPKQMRVYPYPVATMVFNARQDRWAEVVPIGVGILEAVANARRLFTGLPLPGDIIDVSRCDAGWQSSLTHLGVTVDDLSQKVLATAYPTYSDTERYVQRLERLGYQFVAGGENHVLHFGLSIPGGEEHHAFCGSAFSQVSQSFSVRAFVQGANTIVKSPVACKRCLRAVSANFR